MLSKQDLEAFDKLLDKKIEPLKTSVKELGEKIGDLEEKVDDKTSDLYNSIFTLRAENSEDHRGIKRRVKEFKEEFNAFMKHFDGFLQDTRKDVARIKSHLKLPPIS